MKPRIGFYAHTFRYNTPMRSVLSVLLLVALIACGDDGGTTQEPDAGGTSQADVVEDGTTTPSTTTLPDAGDVLEDPDAVDVLEDTDAELDTDVEDEPDTNVEDEPDASVEDEPDAFDVLEDPIDVEDEPDASVEDEPDTSVEPDADERYASTQGLHDTALKDALFDLISGHTSLGYNDARHEMYAAQGGVGIDVDANGLIECVYTGVTGRPDGSRHPDPLNTEHSWPRSDGAGQEPQESDLHHLFPSEEMANQRRGSNPFGITTCTGSNCTWHAGGSELGVNAQGDEVFEVRPVKRGDIARAHFYFSVRYSLPIEDTEETVLRDWHANDPPDDRERERNDAIEALQHNRNPFVDVPEFVERIADF